MTTDTFEFGYMSGNVELSAAPARFLKEIIRVGRYRHPDRADEPLVISPARLRGWVANFYAGPAKVWIPYRHSADPQQNTGWLEDLFVEDDKLFAVMRITDEHAAELLRQGTVADVSVGVERDFVDMDGRRWGEVIRHVALTLDPYIRDQGGFVPLGPATEDDAKGGGEVLATIYAYVDPTTGEGFYPHHADDGAVDMAAARRALEEVAQADLAEDVKDEIRQHLLAHLKEAGEAVAAEGQPADGRLELETRLEALARRNRELRRELKLMHAQSRRRHDDAVAAEVADLVTRGKIVPAVAPRLRALLAYADGAELNLEGERTSVGRLVREILETLPSVVDFGERFVLEPPTEQVPLGGAEKEMLIALGLTPADIRRYEKR